MAGKGVGVKSGGLIAHFVRVRRAVQSLTRRLGTATCFRHEWVNTEKTLPILRPKDVKPTRYEQVWQRVVCPLLQTRSLDEPMARIIEFDYSAFDRFNMKMPDHLLPHLPKDRPGGREGGGVNLRLLLRESVSFPDSRDDPGLQLADIVACAFTKAMNGKLPPTVWRLLGPLMVERPHREPTARLVALGDGPRIRIGDYHTHVLRVLRNVLRVLRNGGKRMFLD